MGWLKILRENKEEKFSWNPDSEGETEAARKRFEHYLKRGFIACKMIDQGKKGVQLSEFDPEAEEIFMLGLADGG
ncbi:MAG: hypothetical protein QME90_15490 [Thermodesulfobacteriota bacterium]|nr:hypothetical protein [Thermodesulfobacteriota bacterium]